MSRIGETFARLRQERKCALIPFITAGDPDLETTRDILIELALAGASIIELGVPFSDPMADGPVIQRASTRALQNGVTVACALQVIRDVRRVIEIPIVLFGYFNPLLQFGATRLSEELRHAGGDGVLITDLPPEESESFTQALTKNELDCILLAAPTTTNARLRIIADRASGFIYAVSRTGVTGAQKEMSSEAEELVARLKGLTDLPVAVGFGISSQAQVQEVCRYADAAVVGSAVVAQIEKMAGAPDIAKRVGDFVRALLPKRED